MKDKPPSDEQQPAADQPPVPSYGLLYITRAYNRKEITLDEWMRQSKAWAEQIIRYHGSTKDRAKFGLDD